MVKVLQPRLIKSAYVEIQGMGMVCGLAVPHLALRALLQVVATVDTQVRSVCGYVCERGAGAVGNDLWMLGLVWPG